MNKNKESTRRYLKELLTLPQFTIIGTTGEFLYNGKKVVFDLSNPKENESFANLTRQHLDMLKIKPDPSIIISGFNKSRTKWWNYKKYIPHPKVRFYNIRD